MNTSTSEPTVSTMRDNVISIAFLAGSFLMFYLVATGPALSACDIVKKVGLVVMGLACVVVSVAIYWLPKSLDRRLALLEARLSVFKLFSEDTTEILKCRLSGRLKGVDVTIFNHVTSSAYCEAGAGKAQTVAYLRCDGAVLPSFSVCPRDADRRLAKFLPAIKVSTGLVPAFAEKMILRVSEVGGTAKVVDEAAQEYFAKHAEMCVQVCGEAAVVFCPCRVIPDGELGEFLRQGLEVFSILRGQARRE